MMAETIGIFGGTFDPPHLGHLILAAEALNQLQLTRVLWVLTPQPPHKPEGAIAPLYSRLEMLKRAIGNTPGFELSTIEVERPGPHYTLDTIDLLQDRHPSALFVLLIGGDSLHDLPDWDRPRELMTAVYKFGVMRRPGDDIDLRTLEKDLPGLTAKLRYFDTPQLEISSTSIRERIAEGGHYRFYLPAGVYDYIQQNRLYR
ncbi:MAG TPA: nicotinate (nicotinamide) nucleotide adenylyltransferase [Anaerolineales bacterium]|jgi:nicotinate-nucleotide adenylyltransferase